MTQGWEPGTQYNLGDKVSYNGCEYKIIQAHRSQSDWAPDVVPALWGKIPNSSHHNNDNNTVDHCHGNKPQQNHCSNNQPQCPPQNQQQQQQPYQQQPYQQSPPPFVQQQPQAPAPAPAPTSVPAPVVHAPQYGDQQTNNNTNYGAIAMPQVLPQNSLDPRKDGKDGFKLGKIRISEDALKIGGGIIGTAAAIGVGAFAYDRYKDSKERSGDEAWGAETWLADARRRQGEYLEAVKNDKPLSPLTWVLTEGGSIPQGAIQAGRDKDGNVLYVGRVYHRDGVYVGKASAIQGDGLHLAYNGKEVVEKRYEILLGYASAIKWVQGSGKLRNFDESKMVQGGRTDAGLNVYVGQAHRSGNILPGGVCTEWDGCYVAYDGDESIETSYQYLVYA